MNRDEFFDDLNEVVRLLGQLGVSADRQAEATERIATMKVGGASITSADLLRHSDAIDWTRQDDAKTLGALSRVLLRVVVGLASELESFRQAHA
jgi:hypothetical protein